MCLIIKNPQRKPTKKLKGYKVYKLNIQDFPYLRLYPMYWHTDTAVGIYADGLVIKSNRADRVLEPINELSNSERSNREVHYGIHTINHLDDAVKLVTTEISDDESNMYYYAIVELALEPEDFVANGVWSDNYSMLCKVYDKVTVTDVIAVYHQRVKVPMKISYNKQHSFSI